MNEFIKLTEAIPAICFPVIVSDGQVTACAMLVEIYGILDDTSRVNAESGIQYQWEIFGKNGGLIPRNIIEWRFIPTR